MPLHKQTIIDKFSELHKKYYVGRGYMISTVNDDVSKKFVEAHPEIVWTFGYNSYARANIQTAKINVTIFVQHWNGFIVIHIRRKIVWQS